MDRKLFNYEQTLELASKRLSEIKDLKDFCNSYNLNYNVVCRFRSKYTAKHYPFALIKTLEALNFQKIQKETCFSFEEPLNL